MFSFWKKTIGNDKEKLIKDFMDTTKEVHDHLIMLVPEETPNPIVLSFLVAWKLRGRYSDEDIQEVILLSVLQANKSLKKDKDTFNVFYNAVALGLSCNAQDYGTAFHVLGTYKDLIFVK